MGKNYVESSLKRFLKRKVKITLGLIVTFLITGAVGYGATEGSLEPDENGDISYKVNTFMDAAHINAFPNPLYTIKNQTVSALNGSIKLEYNTNSSPQSISSIAGVISTASGNTKINAENDIEIIANSIGTIGIDGIGTKDRRGGNGKVNLISNTGNIKINSTGQQDVSGISTYRSTESVTLTANGTEESTGNIIISAISTKTEPIVWGDTYQDKTFTAGISNAGKVNLAGNNIIITSSTNFEQSIGVQTDGEGKETILKGNNEIYIKADSQKSDGVLGLTTVKGKSELTSKYISIEATTSKDSQSGARVYALKAGDEFGNQSGGGVIISNGDFIIGGGSTSEEYAQNILTAEGLNNEGIGISLVAKGGETSAGIYTESEATNILKSVGKIYIESEAKKTSYGIHLNNIANNLKKGVTVNITSDSDIEVKSTSESYNSYGAFLQSTQSKEAVLAMNSDGKLSFESRAADGIAYGIYAEKGDIDLTYGNLSTVAVSTNEKAYGISTINSTLDAIGNTTINVSGKKIDDSLVLSNEQKEAARLALANGNNTISKVLTNHVYDNNGNLIGVAAGAVTQGIRADKSTMTYDGDLFVSSSDIAMTSIGTISENQDSHIIVNGNSHFQGNKYLIALGETTNKLIARPVIQALDGGNITLNGGTLIESMTSEHDESDHIANVGIYAQGHTDITTGKTTSEINIFGDTTINSDIAVMATAGGHVHINTTDSHQRDIIPGIVNITGDLVAGKHESTIDITGTTVNVTGEVIGANGGAVSLDMSNGGTFIGRADDYFHVDDFSGMDFRNDKLSILHLAELFQ